MTSIYISLGSNIEPEKNLRLAVEHLRQHLNEVQVSPVYRTAAVGMDAADFLNAVVAGNTLQSLAQVIAALRAIEDLCGRDRSAPKFSSRSLDLDLLLFGDLVSKANSWSLPRDEIAEHAFVLLPLTDLAADLIHPLTAKPLSEMLKELRQQHPEQFDAMQAVQLKL